MQTRGERVRGVPFGDKEGTGYPPQQRARKVELHSANEKKPALNDNIISLPFGICRVNVAALRLEEKGVAVPEDAARSFSK